jgi:hypothetical protein
VACQAGHFFSTAIASLVKKRVGMPLVYKLVQRHQDSLLSCVAPLSWQVQYVPGKLVKGRRPLFAFNTAESAMMFYARNTWDDVPLNGMGAFEIWESNAPVILDAPARIARSHRDYDTFWEGMEAESYMNPPNGTVICPEGLTLGHCILPASRYLSKL